MAITSDRDAPSSWLDGLLIFFRFVDWAGVQSDEQEDRTIVVGEI